MTKARILPSAVDQALVEINQKSKNRLYARDPEAWVNDVLGKAWWSKQAEIAHDYVNSQRTAIKSANGTGKVVAGNTPLPTPTGWTTAAEAKVGDVLFDESGKPTCVVATSPLWTDTYLRVTFDDGSYIVAHPNHEWSVLDASRRVQRKPVSDWREHWESAKIMTTQEMLDAGLRFGKNNILRWRIPVAEALELPEAELPIDPYLFGLWLADGSTNSGQITFGMTKSDVVDYILDARPESTANWTHLKNSWTVNVHGLKSELRNAGVLGNKHIPDVYLRASAPQRKALLAGIMDGDGFLNKNSGVASVGIDTTSAALADDYYELIVSLGSKVFRTSGEAGYTKDGKRHVVGVRHRLNWRPLENPFRFRGAAWEDSQIQRSRHTVRTVVSIEPEGQETNYCIQVDSPRNLYLAGKSMVPTHNSILVADLVCHFVATRPLGEAVAIISAPTIKQIEAVVFAYLKTNYGLAAANGVVLPGTINESLEWKAKTSSGMVYLALGRKPQDQDIVGSFQGIRRDGGTGVFIDEAGSVPRDLFTAAEAVTTGSGDHKIVAIGNPDLRGTAFHDLWLKDDLGKHWKLHTIKAFDLPTFTGEIVYTDPKRQEAMLSSGMQDPGTVEVWRATWGEDSGRWQSKVLGEFPDEADNTFFSQVAINKAFEAEIEPDPEAPTILGIDVALGGQDETLIYLRKGGHIRKYATIPKMNEYQGAYDIHKIALETGARQIRIDAAGTGQGVYTNLISIPDFAGASYVVIGIQGGQASPDRARWNNSRAFYYDQLREQMMIGALDLDEQDQDLKDQLLAQTYDYNLLGGIQITPKTEQRKKGLKSPDNLDAVVYCAINLDYMLEDPLGQYSKGDIIRMDADDILDDSYSYLDIVGDNFGFTRGI